MVNKDYITAGRAVFTVKLGQHSLKDANPHYTFKVKCKKGDLFSTPVYFVSMLTGSDNESSYTYMGVLDPRTGNVRLTAKSRYTEESVPFVILNRVLYRLWRGEGNLIAQAGWGVMHNKHCGKCGRTLTVPASIESGIGPECAKHLGIGRVTANISKE